MENLQPSKGYLTATPLQALSIFLDRMHDNYLHDPHNSSLDPAHQTYMMAMLTSVDSCYNATELVNYRASTVGSAIVHCIREAFGMIPYWPHSLENLTGVVVSKEDQTSPIAKCIGILKKVLNMESSSERQGGSTTSPAGVS